MRWQAERRLRLAHSQDGISDPPDADVPGLGPFRQACRGFFQGLFLMQDALPLVFGLIHPTTSTMWVPEITADPGICLYGFVLVCPAGFGEC